MNFLSRLCLACAAGGVLIAGALAFSQQSGKQPSPREHSLKHMLDLRAEDEDGQEIGILKDITIDTKTGAPVLAIIKPNSGSNKDLRPVPVELLTTATVKADTLGVRIGTKQWMQGPSVRSEAVARLINRDAIEPIRDFYVKPGSTKAIAQQKAPAPAAATRAPGEPPSPTGTSDPQSAPAYRPGTNSLVFASDIVGKEVINRQQQPIGHVEDLLVDPGTGRPVLAVIQADRVLQREELFVVPLRFLLRNAGKDSLALDATKSMFEQAPVFDKAEWQPGASTGPLAIYRYKPAT